MNEELSELLRYTTHSRELFFDIARKYCKEGSKVLDIGPGTGDFGRPLQGCELFLVEGNPESVEKLRREFDNVLLHQVPDPLPFEPETLDLIHCSHLVEHLQPGDVYSLMKEVNRTLAVGGYFVVSTPLLWDGFYDDLSHVRPYPPTVFRNYLCKDSDARTREIVSREFHVVELRYRYRREPLAYWNISHSWTRTQGLLFRIIKFLRGINLSRYSATGYTLVLQKGHRLQPRTSDQNTR